MAKVRQYFYVISGIIALVLPILVSLKVIGDDQSTSLNQLIIAIGSLIGAGAAGTAGVIVAKQRKDGTLNGPVTASSATEQAIQAIPVVIKQAEQAKSNLDKLRKTVEDSVGAIPIYGDEARAIIEKLPRF